MDTIIGKDVQIAQTLLEQGNVVAIPTETVYGLAANALNQDAVLKIFEAKNRPYFNPLIVHCKSWDQATLFATSIPTVAHKLADQFCPGALTFLLRKTDIIPDLVTSGSDHVAVRVPQHPLALSLLQQLDFPLAAPSANQFGYISPTSAQHVWDSLHGKIPYILDGGATTIGIESTIIGFNNHNDIIIHRLGGISIEDIERVAQKKVFVSSTNQEENKPQSSGQLKSHYAPDTDLIIGDIEELFEQHKNLKLGLISLSEPYTQLNFQQRFILSPNNNLHEAARNLFSCLRQIDKKNLDLILVEKLPNAGLGLAINDRLHRAQSIFK